ncbi:MAG: T9SS type A sorting domain-containing protein [Saprospiraceae bacterium]|nr:T9SS type A sorting domain-containing protein [Saprospiraceae bacterium]
MRYLLFLAFFPRLLFAQSYISYFTGDTADVQPIPTPGVCMMGGATENDHAMRWFLQRANGGDVLVIRASGADGYNDYLFSELGLSVNSVETIVMPNAAAALDPYVAQQIRNAEALWIAGGDQTRYANYWKDKPVEDALRYLIHEKKAVIGGTSAGMAILGEAYFRAANGTITSAEALADPFDPKMDIGASDFLDHPLLQRTITDTHYDNPNRRGRHLAFIARLTQQTGQRYRGIACEEYTAVCVDTSGIARVFGGDNAQDFAWFLHVNCPTPFEPEVCSPGTPLHWVRDSMALKVLRVKGTSNGIHTFDLNDWHTHSGGVWEDWWCENGVLKTATADEHFSGCLSSTGENFRQEGFRVFPNPSGDGVQVVLPDQPDHYRVLLCDLQGNTLTQTKGQAGAALRIEAESLPRGVYFLVVQGSKGAAVRQVVLE